MHRKERHIFTAMLAAVILAVSSGTTAYCADAGGTGTAATASSGSTALTAADDIAPAQAPASAETEAQGTEPSEQKDTRIVQVQFGYEFADGSFDPWDAQTGSIINSSCVVFPDAWSGISASSRVYKDIVSDRKAGYAAAGIDLTDFPSVESSLAVYLQYTDGTSVKGTTSELGDTGLMAAIVPDTGISDEGITMANSSQTNEGISTGYVYSYRQQALDSFQPSARATQQSEARATLDKGTGTYTISTGADSGAAGGILTDGNGTVYGIVTRVQSGTGSAVDVSRIKKALDEKKLAYKEYESEETAGNANKEHTSPLKRAFAFTVLVLIVGAFVYKFIIYPILKRKKGGTASASKAKKRKAPGLGLKKEKIKNEKKGTEIHTPPEVADETLPDDATYEAALAAEAEKIRALEKEERLRRSKEVMKDAEGEYTQVLAHKKYPYMVRQSDAFSFDISSPRFSIGKGEDVQQRITKNPTISGRHCEIIKSGNSYYIHDLGSKNGTSLNGIALHKEDPPTLMEDGDTVKIANETYIYHSAK